MKTWKYKDSNRIWWTVEMRKVSYQDIEGWNDWVYQVKNEEHQIVHEGTVDIQEDMEPSLHSILSDWAQEVTHVAIGFATHGKEEP